MTDGRMTEAEELRRQVDRLKDNITTLELRLQNALVFIEYSLHRQKETKDE